MRVQRLMRWRAGCALLLAFACHRASAPERTPVEAIDLPSGPAPPPAPPDVTPHRPPPPRTPEENAAVLARVESFYAAAAPFECDLDSEVVGAPPANVPIRSRIHLTFERPGRFHMEFAGGLVIVANAGLLTIADPTASGVIQRAVADDYVPLPIAWAGNFSRQTGATTAASSRGLVVISHDAPGGPPTAAFFADPSGEVTRTHVVGGKDLYQVLERVACNMHVKPPPSMFVVSPFRVFKTGPSPLFGVP